MLLYVITEDVIMYSPLAIIVGIILYRTFKGGGSIAEDIIMRK